ncbi:UBP-type zinc finger domain-containing protein [Streptomyces bobili]
MDRATGWWPAGGSLDSPLSAAEKPRYVCQECASRGRQWVALRQCLTCGHVGCCDSSPGTHATAHPESSGHPVARSAELGEGWAWCYADELYLQPRQ